MQLIHNLIKLQGNSSRGAPKVKWVHIVGVYLCGNEINSKPMQQELEEEQELKDSVSYKSSDTNLTRKPNLATDSSNDTVRTELHEDRSQDHNTMQEKLLREEKAAIAVQSAYRGFMVCSILRSSVKLFLSKSFTPLKDG